MLVYLEQARYLHDYRIWLSFNTGEEGAVDLQDLVFKHQAAAPLRTPEAFAEFYLDEWPTLAWPCGFDISPETLYQRVTGTTPGYLVA